MSSFLLIIISALFHAGWNLALKLSDTVVDRLEHISSDTKLQHEALMREKAIRDHYSSLSTAERRGIEKGIEQGRIEGIEKGRKEGKEEGRKEGKEEEKIEIAKHLLAMNLNINDISIATGLSIEDINSLNKK